MLSKLFSIFILLFTNNVVASNDFQIYSFIPWGNHIDINGNKVNSFKKKDDLLLMHNIKLIKVIYHKDFLTDKQPDEEEKK